MCLHSVFKIIYLIFAAQVFICSVFASDIAVVRGGQGVAYILLPPNAHTIETKVAPLLMQPKRCIVYIERVYERIES